MGAERQKIAAVASAAAQAHSLLERCCVCPRRCGVNRMRNELGYCRSRSKPSVYSFAPHHGEEPALSGTAGSGTIFFSHCNMKCVYCQNYSFSQLDTGSEVSIDDLAEMMLSLQRSGCHNINFVSPTHYVPQIVMALDHALKGGLHIPLVYNSGGYDLVETIRLLEGIIDIYLPDMRYATDDSAKRYSDADDYVSYNRNAVIEMHRQAGTLKVDSDGIAERGCIIRLLVLPNGISDAAETIRFIAERISKDTALSIMSQYHPTYKAYHFSDLARSVSAAEYGEVVREARRLGLTRGWVQEGPAGLDPTFFGPNIQPQHPIGE